jgi:hypothetical protein
MMNENFVSALADYLYLAQRGYPERLFLQMVSDHHRLSTTQRAMLYRGAAYPDLAKQRREKLLTIEKLTAKTLHVDGLNVLTTVASYLAGIPVFVAMDGLVRDAAQLRGGLYQVRYERPVLILIKALMDLPQAKAVVYLDEKATISEKIAEWLRRQETNGVEVLPADKVDRVLLTIREGVIATSDRQIIDATVVSIFDLASHILHQNFVSKIPDLKDLISIAG